MNALTRALAMLALAALLVGLLAAAVIAGSGHVETDGDAGASWHLLNHEGDMVDWGRSPHPDHAMDEVEKRMLQAGLLREADWTVYDDDIPQENRSVPSTEVKSPPSDWARRDGEGKWSPPAIPARPAG